MLSLDQFAYNNTLAEECNSAKGVGVLKPLPRVSEETERLFSIARLLRREVLGY